MRQLRKMNSRKQPPRQLSLPQLEQAFQWLAHQSTQPPQELENLSKDEWVYLCGMLNALLEEKSHHPLQ
jgi:hypothetical protein